MEFPLPHEFGLTAPRVIMFSRSCTKRVRSTKGFYFLLSLGLFVDTTVAIDREIPAGLEFSERINMGPDSMNEDYQEPDELFNVKIQHSQSSASSPNGQTSIVSSTMATPTASEPAPASESRGTPINDDNIFGHTDDPYFVENLINGIAQDLFFHPTEMNFYESKWQAALKTWAEGAETARLVKEHPKVSLEGLYAQNKANWTGMQCNVGLKGCTRMPSPEHVRRYYELDPHEARRVIFTLDAFRKTHAEVAIYKKALHVAKNDLELYCREFASIFFHPGTKGHKKMCVEKIIQIVLGVITAIISIVTMGMFISQSRIAGVNVLISSGSISADLAFALAISGGIKQAVSEAVMSAGIALEAGVGAGLKLGIDANEAPLRTGKTEQLGQVASADLDDFDMIIPASSSADESIGSAAGVVGESAASWSTSEVSDFYYDSLSEFALYTDAELMHSTKLLPEKTQKAATNAAIELEKLSLSERPWSQLKLTVEELANAATRAANYARLALNLKEHPTIGIEYTRRVLLKKMVKAEEDRPACGQSYLNRDQSYKPISGAVDTQQVHDEIAKWTQDVLIGSLIAGYGQEIGAKNVSKYVEEERLLIHAKQNAIHQTFNRALGSFARSKAEMTSLPKVWGSFSHLELLRTDNLKVDARGEASLYDHNEVQSLFTFERFQRPATLAQRHRLGPPTSMKFENHSTTMSRITKLFTAYEVDESNSTPVNINSPSSLGPRLTLRFQGMSAELCFKFLEMYADEITRRVQYLRTNNRHETASHSSKPYVGLDPTTKRSTFQHVPLKECHGSCPSRSQPKIKFDTAYDTASWVSLLGSIDFKGFEMHDMSDPNVPELRWHAQPSHKIVSKLGKRQADKAINQFALHHVRGMLDTLESHGLISKSDIIRQSGNRKKSMDVGSRSTANEQGEMFIARVHDHLFKNPIHHEVCGTDSFTGDQSKNVEGCRGFLNKAVQQVDKGISTSSDFSSRDLKKFERAIRKRYSTYETYLRADHLALHKPKLKKKLRNILKNSLISKAYGDQNCYLRCKPSKERPKSLGTSWEVSFSGEGTNVGNGKTIHCHAGCYNPIWPGHDRLYGFKDDAATGGIWKLNEHDITNVSWNAYINHDFTGFVPGRVDLNPYRENVKEGSPILPVCFMPQSFVGGKPSALPCSCGNVYGNETAMVLQASAWNAPGKNYEREEVKSCHLYFGMLAQRHPGAYLINMCNIFYRGVTPLGGNSWLEQHNRGHYWENYLQCTRYWGFYEANKHKSHEEIDGGICNIWNRAAHITQGQMAKRKDFDFAHVNKAVEIWKCGGRYDRIGGNWFDSPMKQRKAWKKHGLEG